MLRLIRLFMLIFYIYVGYSLHTQQPTGLMNYAVCLFTGCVSTILIIMILVKK